MFNFIFVIVLLNVSLILGSLDGKASAQTEIGESCLKKGSFEVKGHTFKCERTKIKEGL